MLSEAVVERLRAHLERLRELHEVDRAAGLPGGLVSGSPGTEMAGGCYRRLGMNPSVSPDSWARMAAMRWVTNSLSTDRNLLFCRAAGFGRCAGHGELLFILRCHESRLP